MTRLPDCLEIANEIRDLLDAKLAEADALNERLAETKRLLEANPGHEPAVDTFELGYDLLDDLGRAPGRTERAGASCAPHQAARRGRMNAELREAIRQARDRQTREDLARGPNLYVPPELRFARCEAITHWGKPCPWTAEPEKGFCEYHLKHGFARQDEEAEGDEEELDVATTLQQNVTKSGSSDLIGPKRSFGPTFARSEDSHVRAERGHGRKTPALCDLSGFEETPEPALSPETGAAVTRGRPKYEERRTA